MQRGLLTGKFSPAHTFNKGDTRAESPYFRKQNIIRVNAFLDDIRHIADDKGATMAQLAVRWTLEQPGITVALVGARDSQTGG